MSFCVVNIIDRINFLYILFVSIVHCESEKRIILCIVLKHLRCGRLTHLHAAFTTARVQNSLFQVSK